ncbi:MAG: AbrB family DNA-binding protein [Desulfurococcales archaeon]|nr:AbrB family DNA-binding protein [Desulfurococcales archaeon]
MSGMRLTALVRVDSKGRITIPQTMREMLSVEPGMLMAIIADSETKELIVSPISAESKKIFEITTLLKDKPGALASVTDEMAKAGADIVTARCASIIRGEEAECVFIVDLSGSKMGPEELKDNLSRLAVVMQVKIKSFEPGMA